MTSPRMTPAADNRNALAGVVDSPLFTTAIFVVILFNAAVLGAQTYPGLVGSYGSWLELANDACLAVFVVELSLRLASYGRHPQHFFRSGWNVFDLVVVSATLLPGLSQSSTLLRIARLLRVIRIVRLLPDLRVLLVAVARSLPPLGSMSVLTALILFLYGMVGWTIFGDSDPDAWGNIGLAMLTLFVLLSLESLPALLERGMEIHPWSWIYFVSFALVAAFIVLNLLIGVVINSMEEAREIEARRAERAAAAELGDGAASELPVAERLATLRALIEDLERDVAARDGHLGPPRPATVEEPSEHSHRGTADL